MYKAEVELQLSNKVKRFRTDNDSEYYDPNYYQSMCILHETIVDYTPKQNGTTERKNRTLQEMVNSMLF